MDKKKTVHILSHTHWDREWYLDSKYTNRWLVPFFENLFLMMEKEPDYKFILDGQLLMIEDYFDELSRQGKEYFAHRQKIKKFVKEGRLIIGPYYLQPDWQLVSGESLIRNIFYGQKAAKGLGGSMKIGWLLDNFGQISQSAQIHKDCGMEGLFLWRGVEMNPDQIATEFLWESPDHTALPAIYMVNSYRNAMRLASHKHIAKQRISDEVDKMSYFNKTSQVLLMNGYDQDLEPDDVRSILSDHGLDHENYMVIQSTPEKYLNAVLSEKPQLQALMGAMYSGRFCSVFPGVMSARIYLKLQNDISQKTLETQIEPLSAFNWILGGEYGHEAIEELWKTLLKNQPHDSICGVSIDPVHTDMENRHYQLQSAANRLFETKMRKVCSLIHIDADYLVFNPSPYTRREIIKTENGCYCVSLPALGYKTIKKCEAENHISFENHTADNGILKLWFNQNGTFNVVFKETGMIYNNLGLFQDMGDAGDSYNYSYPDSDTVVTSENSESKIEIAEHTSLYVTFKVSIELSIPSQLNEDRKSRSSERIILPIVSFVTLEVGSPVVKVKTFVKNTAKGHVLKVLFPTNIHTDFSYGGSPFDIVKRPIATEDFDEARLPAHVKAVIIGAREPKANSFYLQKEFVDLNDGKEGLSILNKGLPEYEILQKENTIAVTLFRGTSIIAGEINTRLGDAGPNMFTPDGECLREMSFEYAVYPHMGDTYKGNVIHEADQFNNDVILVKSDVHEGSLAPEKSFMSLSDDANALRLTAFKVSECSGGVILRFYNSSEEEVTGKIQSQFKIIRAYATNLLEENKHEIQLLNANTIELLVAAKKIVTLKLEIERENYVSSEESDISIVRWNQEVDFSKYESLPAVTNQDLEREELRANTLLEKKDMVFYKRAALEAELSYILAKTAFEEQKINQLGFALNDARVKRRLYDYIAGYMENNSEGAASK